MKIPSEKELERIRREYPVGTIIELINMSSIQAPPVGFYSIDLIRIGI